MVKDFNNFGHKNAELLRHYIVKEIRKIDKKITNNSSQIAGYFIASFVDILIVMIFDDFLKKESICFRIILVVIFCGIFIILSKIISACISKSPCGFFNRGKAKI